MNKLTMDEEMLAVCFVALENTIESLSEYIHDTKPPKSAMVYRNREIAKTVKARLENHDDKIRFSELKFTHASLESLKIDINDSLLLPDNTEENIEEMRSIRRSINKTLRFLRSFAQSLGHEIDEYKHDDPIDI